VPRFARLSAAAAAATLLAVGGYVAGAELASPPASPSPSATCELGSGIPTPACHAAGAIRFGAVHNLQGAAQFCRWREANPREWLRLKEYARTGTPPTNIVTWFGAAIRNQIEAYFATGAPAFEIAPNTAPNVCRTPLPAPTVVGVTPGETDVTVTVDG